MQFDYENTWSPYRELVLTPAVTLFWDRSEPEFRCIMFHFLAWKCAITLDPK